MKLFLFFSCFFISLVVSAQPKLVNVNGIQYNVLLKGFENRKGNSPVLILESGMGSPLGNWDKVIDQLAAIAPVFSYDRANLGKSQKTYQLPTAKHVAESLHNILTSLKIAPPYILVGHSLGGVYIRSFAGLYPTEISGLVFIDPADFTETKNDWNNIFRKLGVAEPKIEEMMQNRLYRPSRIDTINFGPSSEAQILGDLRRNDFEEIAAMPLPKVPVYFFVGGKFEVPPERRSKDYDHEAFFHVKNNSNMDRWKKLIYSTGKPGNLIYLTNAGHYIHRDDPNSVVSNIRVMIEGLKNQK